MASLIYYYCKEISQHSYELDDEPSNIEFFKKVWEIESTKRVTDETLRNSSLWGQNLGEIKPLNEMVNFALEAIHSHDKIAVAYDVFKKMYYE